MRRLEPSTAQRVRQSVIAFTETGHGDIVKLQGREAEWRLRVGAWRVRFDFTEGGRTLRVLRVLHRREAYR